MYETPATSISMVGADGKATVFAGPNVTLDEIDQVTALNVLGTLLVAHEQFPDAPLTASGWALPVSEEFPDMPFPMEWEF